MPDGTERCTGYSTLDLAGSAPHDEHVVEQLLLDGQRAHELLAWALDFVVAINFFALCILAWVMYVARQIHREVDEVIQRGREHSERMERMQYYLFGQLGPLDLK